MSIKKVLKITGISVLTLTCMAGLVLVIHIYQMKELAKQRKSADVLLLGRVDFKQDIDSISARSISGFVKSMKGVKSVYFNVKDDVLVYTFMSKSQSAASIYNAIQAKWPLKAELYKVSKEQMANGCPAGMEDKGFMASVSSGMEKLFK